MNRVNWHVCPLGTLFDCIAHGSNLTKTLGLFKPFPLRKSVFEMNLLSQVIRSRIEWLRYVHHPGSACKGVHVNTGNLCVFSLQLWGPGYIASSKEPDDAAD